jgi:hypothetical protein
MIPQPESLYHPVQDDHMMGLHTLKRNLEREDDLFANQRISLQQNERID